MKFRKNIRANQTFNVLTFMFGKIGFLLIVLFFLVFIYNSYFVSSLDTTELESQLFMHSMLNNKDGFIFFDKITKRAYPEIIDLSKFNMITLDSIQKNSINYGEDNNHLAAKITLQKEDSDEITSLIYNEKWYSRWDTLARTGVKGPGGAKEYTKSFYVLIKDKEDLTGGFLEISVTLPNS